MKRFLLSIIAVLCIAGEAIAQIPELKPLKDLEELLIPSEKKGKWGYVNHAGKMVIKPVFEVAGPFEAVTSPDGTTMEVARIKANGSWGYITRENVYLIEPVHDTISVFDQYATVIAESGPFKTLIGVRSAISPRLGVPVLVCNFLQMNLSEIGEFSENGLAFAAKSGKYGMLNTKGEWAIPCQYESLDLNPHGGYQVVLGGKMGILKADGTILVEPQYDGISWEPALDAYLVQKDGGMGLVSEDGNRIAPPVYISIEPLGMEAFIVRKNERYGLLGRDGRILLQSYYDSIAPCSGGGYYVTKDGEHAVVAQGDEVIIPYGYWTANPEELLAAGYESIEWNAVAEMFIVHKGDKVGAIWADGSFALETEYDAIEYQPYGWLLTIDGQHEALDKELNYIIGRGPWTADLNVLFEKYVHVSWDGTVNLFTAFVDEYNSVCLDSAGNPVDAPEPVMISENGKYGMASVWGEVLLPPIFDGIVKQPYGYLVSKDGLVAACDDKLNIILGFGPWSLDLVALFEQYDIVDSSHQYGFIVNKDGKYGAISPGGNNYIPVIYDSLAWDDSGHWFVAILNGESMIIDAWGEVMAPGSRPEPSRAWDFTLVSKDGKYGLINHFGDVVEPIIFDSIEKTEYGYLLIMSDGTHHALTHYLMHIIAPGPWTADIASLLKEYETVAWSDNPPVLWVSGGGKYGLLAPDGSTLLPLIYDKISWNEGKNCFETIMEGVPVDYDLSGNPR